MNLLAAGFYAVPSLFAFLAWLQGRRNGRTAKAINEKVDAVQGLATSVQGTVEAVQMQAAHVETQVGAVTQKTEVIHGLVNSAMSALKADLALANQRIEALQDLVNKMTSERASRDAAIQAVKDAPRT